MRLPCVIPWLEKRAGNTVLIRHGEIYIWILTEIICMNQNLLMVLSAISATVFDMEMDGKDGTRAPGRQVQSITMRHRVLLQ